VTDAGSGLCPSPLSHPPVAFGSRDCPRGLPYPTCHPSGKTAPIGTRHTLSDLRAADRIALSPMSLSIYDGPVLFFDPPAPCVINPSPPIRLCWREPEDHPHRHGRVLRRGGAAGQPGPERTTPIGRRVARAGRRCRSQLRGPPLRRALGHVVRGRPPPLPRTRVR
jgi:hypothetical protein